MTPQIPKPDPSPAPGDDSVSHAAEYDRDVPLVSWESLECGKGRIQISFQGMLYQLRVTRNGKLILTK